LGGVSGRSACTSRRSNPSDRGHGRHGGKHPGLRDVGTLRGVPAERRPRSVRRRLHGTLPVWAHAPATTDARRTPRRGTSSACDNQTHARFVRAHIKRLSSSGIDGSFTRSFGTCASIVTTLRHALKKRLVGGAVGRASRSGKPGQPGGTGSGVRSDGRSAARRASPLPQGRRR